ncbi:MAG TPA: hypothetical protein VFB36_12715 [Nevskiaceae bacterium]|nr:hypothetical protein [Nevskiaceae bacterium]
MRNWKILLLVAGVALTASCAQDRGRPGVASRAFDCYDWWPYVYSAPMDCWYGPHAWYDPGYFYYQPYPAYSYGAPIGAGPGRVAPRVERPRPLAGRERRPLEGPEPDALPVPIPRPPRTLPP